MELGIEIVGERKVALKFDEFPKQAHDRLLARITDLTAELAARVRGAEPERTGALKRATASTVNDSPDRITGRVSITADFGKAGALEYGAHGTTKVRAHSARLDHIFSRLVSPMSVMVAQHTRRLNIADHRFLRGPVSDMSGEVVARLREALTEAAEAQ